MDIFRKKEFDNTAQRILYGFLFVYSDFEPVASDTADAQAQKKLHESMGRMLGRLYETPALLGLPENPDEAYEWYEVSNRKPALSAVYLSAYKTLYEFYKFLYVAALHGEPKEGSLSVRTEILKANRTGYKPVYNKLLNEAGMEAVKEKSGVLILADGNIPAALKLLAEKVPTGINQWTPFELADFARCSFCGEKEYLLLRTDRVNGLNGLLIELQNKCMEKGYSRDIRLHFTATDLSFAVCFKTETGGFQIGYSSRKYRQFSFGTMNGIGEKAMLEDFENLDEDMQRHFVGICRPCSGCLSCTKNGKNKIFTVRVHYAGKEHSLCPCFPCHEWETLDGRLAEILFRYHDLQTRYKDR